MENRALGKGLSALIPKRTEFVHAESSRAKTADIKENIFQPRSNFDDEKLAELISSIKEKGVLQPIIVRQKDQGYEVIAGERRLRAAKALGLEEVPIIIKNVDDQEALVLALVENIQRQELNAIEEAQAFQRLMSEFNITQDVVAQLVGKDRTTIANLIRLLKLPAVIQQSVLDGQLSMGHARALVGIEDLQEQKRLFEEVLKKDLSVRELENLLKTVTKKFSRRKKAKSAGQDQHLQFMEEELQRLLGTKVRIVAAKKRGKIIVEYYSTGDLERILGIIKK